ncbi:MAG: hypothetical protein E7387_04840 [Ruminococcaceae bacterium]|nr:hypothetical protein [Oscillospiraceae bacterium]
MKITLVLKESIFDCKVRITDSYGERYYDISCLCEEGTNCSSIEAEIFDSEFSLLLIPVMPDTLSILNEFEPKDWKEKFAKKTTGFLMNSLCKMLLHVACNYYIVGLQDGDRLDITLQSYAFGKIDRFNVLGLVPMIYLFFEVANFNDFYKLTDAYETNRKDVLKFARTLAFTEVLGNGLFLTLFIYPIQVSRIKRLTKNKKLLKVLTKFNSLSNTERQIFLEKQERFFDRY